MSIQKTFIKIFQCVFIFFLVLFPGRSNLVTAEDITKDTSTIHHVLPGESLHEIALRYLPLTAELTVNDLVAKIKVLSGIEGTLIRPNQKLLIPLVRSSPIAAKTVPKPIDFEAKGIYVNRYTMVTQKMKRLVDELIAVGGNTVILDGKDMSGTLSYPSQVNLAKEIGADANPVTRDLGKLIHYLHTMGIHVGVRQVLFYDQLLAEQQPELAAREGTTGDPLKETGKIAWVDPSNPLVQDYNLSIAKELAAMGIDEIQFDYIRFPTKKNVQYGESCPNEKTTPRHEIITQFLARAREELAAHKVLLSIDVFGIIAWGRYEDVQMTGQKIEDLARYCDVISPMIYPSHFDRPFQGIPNPNEQPYFLVSQTCLRFSRLLSASQATLRPWIQAFPMGTKSFDADYVIDQLRGLEGSTARGWLLWSAGNKYDVAWKGLAEWKDDYSPDNTLSANLRLKE